MSIEDNYFSFIEDKTYQRKYLQQLFSRKYLLSFMEEGLLVASNGLYKFKFVGVVTCYEKLIVIVPKMYEEEDVTKDVIRILVASLKQYALGTEKLYKGIDYFSDEPEDIQSSELAIADFIINDYQTHGIYYSQKSLNGLNGFGNLDWSYTINEIEPVFNNGNPIYFDTYNEVTEIDNYHVISELHKWSIAYCYKYLPFFGQENNTILFSCARDLCDIAEIDELLYHIDHTLAGTYSDREIRLLKSLKFLIYSKIDPDQYGSISLYGTRNFEYVWEEICRKLIHCNQFEIVKDILKKLPDSQWKVFNFPIVSGRIDLRPDILVYEKSNKTLYILDAKYYPFKIDPTLSCFSGEPESSSVLKQFFYQKYYSALSEFQVFHNAFLIPVNDRDFNHMIDCYSIKENCCQFISCGTISFEPYYFNQVINILILPISDSMNSFINRRKINLNKVFEGVSQTVSIV